MLDRPTKLAQKSANIVSHFGDGLQGILYKAVRSSNPIAAKSRFTFYEHIYAHYRQTIDELQGLFFETVNRLMSEAESASGARITDEQRYEIHDYLHATIYNGWEEVSDQLLKSLGVTMRWFDDFCIRVRVLMSASNHTPRSAAIKVEQEMRELPRAVYNDSRGRKWQMSNYVLTRFAQIFLDTYNTSMIYFLSLKGDTLAVIDSDSEAHSGVVFSISDDDSEYPSYFEIREKHFHPRSDSFVSPYISKR